MPKSKFGTEKRADGAKWTSKHVGVGDFAEEIKMRPVGTFEKGQVPADLMDRKDEPDKPTVEG